MKIAVAQIKCHAGDVDANVTKIASQIEKAAASSCDLVVLPEMVDTGYEMGAIMEKASGWEAGPVARIRELAARCTIAVCCGVSERVEGGVYNSQILVDQNGSVAGHYRKAHLFTGSAVNEERYLLAGDTMVTAQIGDFKIGLMICYDIRFPEMARALALKGVDVFLVSAAWPAVRVGHWRTLLAARAIENQAYVAAAKLYGADAPVPLAGNSVILDPSGECLAEAGPLDEAMPIGEVNRDTLESVRAQMAVFRDRRGELYGTS